MVVGVVLEYCRCGLQLVVLEVAIKIEIAAVLGVWSRCCMRVVDDGVMVIAVDEM